MFNRGNELAWLDLYNVPTKLTCSLPPSTFYTCPPPGWHSCCSPDFMLLTSWGHPVLGYRTMPYLFRSWGWLLCSLNKLIVYFYCWLFSSCPGQHFYCKLLPSLLLNLVVPAAPGLFLQTPLSPGQYGVTRYKHLNNTSPNILLHSLA